MKTSALQPVLRILLASSLLVSTGCSELIGVLEPLFPSDTPSVVPTSLPTSLPSVPPSAGPSDVPEQPIADPDLSNWQPPALPAVHLQKGRDESGQLDAEADMQTVSAEYQVQLLEPQAGETTVIQLPLSQLPVDFNPALLQPERYDPGLGQWLPSGQLAWYDPDSQSVWFRDRLPVSATGFVTSQSTALPVNYRVRIYLFSNQQTAFREGSRFRIHYYPSGLKNKSSIKSDLDWNSPNGSEADNVPDFIEDLDRALNSAYDELLKLTHSQGKVFKPLDVQDVYVCDTGKDAGDSKLGGPLRISNSKITSYEDLKLTAAHELVHVFQGQHYSLKGLFTGRLNHWFIEAVANYYAARANQLDDSAKKDFYGDFYSNYLSVGLTTADDNSMYAAGHFLDWLEQQYGQQVVAEALRLSAGNDMVGLSNAIRQHSRGAASLGGAFEDYLTAILTQPEATAGFHLKVRNAMSQHALGYGYQSTGLLNTDRNYARVTKSLPPLSAAMISLNTQSLNRTRFSDDLTPAHLWVMANLGNQGALLNGSTFLMESELNKAYADARPIDRYLNHTGFSEWNQFLDFPVFSQLMVNSSPASSAKVDMAYYALKAPYLSSDSQGRPGVNLKQSIGNIPPEQLLGFKAYDYRGELLLGPVAVQQSGDFQLLNVPENKYAQLVTVVDRYGNEWPYSILIKVTYPKDKGYLDPGETARLEARLIGFEDDQLKWQVTGHGDYGTFSAGTGKQATLNFGTWGAVNITVSSHKYPFLKANVSITDVVGGCVQAGTLVTLADGSRKAIETLKAGDAIQAWDQASGQVVKAQVRQLLIHHEAPYTLHRLQGADGDEIQITGNHPVYTREQGWIPVDQLKPGMTLFQLDHGSSRFLPTQVKGIVRESSLQQVVYNLLTSAGNYFANDLLIHNKCLAPGTLIESPDGPLPVEQLKAGDTVFSASGEMTLVRKVFHKQTALPFLPAKRLPTGGKATYNHLVFWQGAWQQAGQTDLPDTQIAGAVYDLETEAGTYLSGELAMGQPQAQQKQQLSAGHL